MIMISSKQKTEKEIVEQGVSNKEQLDAFLAERGVSLPADLTEFEIEPETSKEKKGARPLSGESLLQEPETATKKAVGPNI